MSDFDADSESAYETPNCKRLHEKTKTPLPTGCYCGLGDDKRVRKWALTLMQVVEETKLGNMEMMDLNAERGAELSKEEIENLREKRIEQMRTLQAALEKHLTICFQMNDHDAFLPKIFKIPPKKRPATTKSSLLKINTKEPLPIRLSLELPDQLICDSKISSEFSDIECSEDSSTWSTQLRLFVQPKTKQIPQVLDKSTQVNNKFTPRVSTFPTQQQYGGNSFDCNSFGVSETGGYSIGSSLRLPLGQISTSLPRLPGVYPSLHKRQSRLAAIDLRRGTIDKNQLILPETYEDIHSSRLSVMSMKSSLRGSRMEADWINLEKLESETWDDDQENLSPLHRQASFLNYIKILTETLNKCKSRLERLEKRADNNYNSSMPNISKAKLEIIAKNRSLRENVKIEIEYLEEQMKLRIELAEKESNTSMQQGAHLPKDRERYRFAKSIKTIYGMIEILGEQIKEQLYNPPVNEVFHLEMT